MPVDWIICPCYDIWPRKRKRAVLWILAQLVTFCHDNYQETTLLEYINHIRMGKEKLYQHPKRRRLVADCLMVLDV
jgi:hypothetical protein